MRFLKTMLAGATLVALAVPALASADPYWGGHAYHRDRGEDRSSYDNYGRGDRSYGDRGYHYGAWRHHRDHSRDYGYRYGERDHWQWQHRGW